MKRGMLSVLFVVVLAASAGSAMADTSSGSSGSWVDMVGNYLLCFVNPSSCGGGDVTPDTTNNPSIKNN